MFPKVVISCHNLYGTYEEVYAMLKQCGAENYVQTFKDNLIDDKTLPFLTVDHLKELLPLGIAIKVIAACSNVSCKQGSTFRRMNDFSHSENSAALLMTPSLQRKVYQNNYHAKSNSMLQSRTKTLLLNGIHTESGSYVSTENTLDSFSNRNIIDVLSSHLVAIKSDDTLKLKSPNSISEVRGVKRSRSMESLTHFTRESPPEENCSSFVEFFSDETLIPEFTPEKKRCAVFNETSPPAFSQKQNSQSCAVFGESSNIYRKSTALSQSLLVHRKKGGRKKKGQCKRWTKKRVLRQSGFAPITQKEILPPETRGESEVDENHGVRAALQSLKFNFDPEKTILVNWHLTRDYRFSNKKNTVEDYFNEYPCLRDCVTGPKLIYYDFICAHGEKEDGFFNNWTSASDLLLKLAQQYINTNDPKWINYVQELGVNLCTRDKEERKLFGLLLLPYFFPVPSICGRKTGWKSSRIESVNEFIKIIPSVEEVSSHLKHWKELQLKRELPTRPLTVLVGSPTKIITTFVLIGDRKYYFSSIFLSFDFCFKSFFALNVRYPPEAHFPFMFVQYFMYNIAPQKSYARINQLWRDLKHLQYRSESADVLQNKKIALKLS